MRAVLFDLDGTLLDIDLDGFLQRYFGALGPVIAGIVGATPTAAIQAVVDATDAMMRPHPDRTNREAFDARFRELTGIDLGDHQAVIDDFYGTVFPGIGAGLGPTPDAHAAVEAAREAGFLVGVATNPIFPAAAVYERMRWAGFAEYPFACVTTYEVMHSCKPGRAYFEETASMIGAPAEECLMVGDDPVLDLGAKDAGMRTYFTGGHAHERADHEGTLAELVELLPRLAPSR